VPEHAPLYRPVAAHLPAIYQEDAESWAQVTGYLGLLDELFRAYAAQVEDVTTWLSPAGVRQPAPGRAPGTTAEVEELLDELADWFAFRFPASWDPAPGAPDAEVAAALARRRDFVLRAARFWRRRGTPQGLVAWLSFLFALDTVADRPIVLEHFKYRPAGDTTGSAEGDDDPYALRLSVLVPRTAAFDDYRRRRELVEAVERWAPAHLMTRVCWFDPDRLTATDDTRIDPADVARTRALLADIRDFIPEADGIHLHDPDVAPAAGDRLGHGRLPNYEGD
jgi:hypothetical protein